MTTCRGICARRMRSQVVARCLLAALLAVAGPLSRAQTTQLHGDVGIGWFRTPAITRAAQRQGAVLPYVYADDGPWYARIDTFGFKAMPMGRGHLELAARVSFEGYRPADPAFGQRSTPVPLGLGTFQETEDGAFIVYALADPVSGGSLLDAAYAAELGTGRLHVYPQVGAERRSARYVRHLYGISAAEALRSGMPGTGQGTSSLSPNAALSAEVELGSRMKLTGMVRRRWLDRAITSSPLVTARTQTSLLLALTRSFP